MDSRMRDFIVNVAQDVVGLEIALFFQSNPATFDTDVGLALRLRRTLDEVHPALERLAEGGVLEVFTRGDGKYHCYSLAREAEVWRLLCLVSEAYLDQPEVRKEIVRLLVKRHRELHPHAPAPD